uniref:Succinate--CoA ligase subunit beta n=1 Tax=Thermofilum pendens TaxID=2269 RepID=A0A7C4FAZ9_THEPE
MILYEFEVKSILEKLGVPVEPSCVVSSKNDSSLLPCLKTIGPPFMVKAQVRGWGRGKRGLIIPAETEDDAVQAVKELFSSSYEGQQVRYVMVSRKVQVLKEYYLALMLDADAQSILLLASREGGIDVEELAQQPGGLLLQPVDPLVGLRGYMVRRVANYLGLETSEVSRILNAMYTAFWKYNMILLELNPLALTEGGLIAIDRKAVIDDDALQFNSDLAEFTVRFQEELSEVQRVSLREGFAVVEVGGGELAVVGNGAGLTMATMDYVEQAGGRPGLFLDLGGGASAERVEKALLLVMSLGKYNKVLLNILGGITRCDEVARGILRALDKSGGGHVKIVVRLSGFMEKEARNLLESRGIRVFRTLEEAAKEVVS